MNTISELILQLPNYFITIVLEPRLRETTHIFEHHGARFGVANNFQSLGEQVPIVIGTQLFPSHRERGTRNSTGDEIHAEELFPIDIMHIFFTNIPPLIRCNQIVVPICPKSLACPVVVFEGGEVVKASVL